MPGILDLLTPVDIRDLYPITDPKYQIGGFRDVQTISDRNSISQERRRAGMFCYVRSENILYILGDGLTNSDWTTFDPGSNLSNSVSFEEIIITNSSGVINDSGVLNDVNINNLSTIGFINAESISGFYANINDNGKLLFVHNLGINTLTLKNNSNDSLEGNRIYTGINNDVFILPKSAMLLQYLTSDLHWRIISGIGNSNFSKTINFSNVSLVTINHNLGYLPAIFLFDISGVEAFAQINYVNNNQVILTFNKNESGYVVLK
jgi:hypothetical protein